jgi:hypothetical protein
MAEAAGTRRFDRRWAHRRMVLGLALVAVVGALGAGGRNVQADAAISPELRSGVALLLVQDPGCPYCARWDEEVRPGYERSPEGRFAPLVRRLRSHPDVAAFPGVVYSPTFIVLRDGREVGRLIGYPGADFFWAQIGEILLKAGFRPEDGQKK